MTKFNRSRPQGPPRLAAKGRARSLLFILVGLLALGLCFGWATGPGSAIKEDDQNFMVDFLAQGPQKGENQANPSLWSDAFGEDQLTKDHTQEPFNLSQTNELFDPLGSTDQQRPP
jgi:hypothetical protein